MLSHVENRGCGHFMALISFAYSFPALLLCNMSGCRSAFIHISAGGFCSLAVGGDKIPRSWKMGLKWPFHSSLPFSRFRRTGICEK